MNEVHIFISYRREDSAGHAGRIYDKLAQQFGEAQVFLDFDAIPGATNFREEIRDALRRANVVLVVIGPRWATAADEQGNRRLDDDRDLVRREIRTALDSDVAVFAVLVGGARMPHQDDLPDDLAGLTDRDAIEISDRRFREDCDRLISDISRLSGEEVLPTPGTEIPPGWWAITKSNYGMAPVTLQVELRRDGSLQGHLGNLGPVGDLMRGLDEFGMVQGMLGQVRYGGQWTYDKGPKVLTLQLVGQVGMFGGGAETWRMQIVGGARGVYQATGAQMDNYELRRIG